MLDSADSGLVDSSGQSAAKKGLMMVMNAKVA